MTYPRLTLELPAWVSVVAAEHGADDRPLESIEDRMRLAIALSRRSAASGGGPFGAAVFELESRRLVAPGVNLVAHSLILLTREALR